MASDKLTADSQLSGIATSEAETISTQKSFPQEDPSPRVINTSAGCFTAIVQGKLQPCAIVTFHDVGIDPHVCFRTFFSQPGIEAVLERLCVIHLVAPGQEPGAAKLDITAYPTLEELATAVNEIVLHFDLKDWIGVGAGIGGNILLRTALQHPSHAISGIVCFGSPVQQAGWLEWSGWKVVETQLSFSGEMNASLEDQLLSLYFSSATLDSHLDLVNSLRQYMRASLNVHNAALFLAAYYSRTDILPKLDKKFKPPTFLACGSHGPYLGQLEQLNSQLNAEQTSMLKLYDCGTLIHEERPQEIFQAFVFFLQGLGHIVTV